MIFLSVIGMYVQFEYKSEKDKDIFTYSHSYHAMTDTIA